ncbi:unnamed protein product [Heterobilharzia americana]|nr:unnamed protein product [Heterobilharzia americana]
MALQNLQHICPVIDEKQREHEIKRKSEKMEVEQRRQRRSEKSSDAFGLTDQDGEDFWHEKVPYTPESRIEMHERMRMQATLKESKKDSSLKKNEGPKLFAEDGRPYNINRAKIPFSLEDNTLDGQDVYLLSVAVYKYMDTALIECDIRTNYVRVTLKGKILQIALPEEVRPDSSSVKRSLITGHLLITMPKASCEVGKPKYSENKCKVNENNLTKHGDSSGNQHSDSKSPASQNCSNLLLEIEKPSANKNQQAFEKISSEGFRYHMNNNRKPADAKQNRKCTHDCSEVPQLI